MGRRHREQARSHKKPGAILQAQALRPSRSGDVRQVKHRTLCASLLAKAGCQATVMLAVLASSRASPLPQGSLVNTRFVHGRDPNVGASLLANAGCQATGLLAVLASSRASPLPQGSLVNTGFVHGRDSNVGAGLLAKAGCQATGMLAVLASSRASPLPQGSLVNTRFVYGRDSNVGACSRRRCIRQLRSQIRKLPTS